MMCRNRFLLLATAVLLLAAVLRLVALADVPPGLSQDEVLNADIVTFIRQGKHALFFREGYGHEPLYHYYAVPFQVLLGDNVLSIRLPAVWLGLLLIALTLRWLRRDFDGITAVVAGVGLAVSWWPLIFSRIGLRPILEPVLLVLAAWCWPRRPWWAGVFLGLSLYSYTAARIIWLLPLGMLLYGLMGRKWTATAERRILTPALITLGLCLLLYLPLGLTLRADPTLQQRVTQLEGPLQALRQGEWRPIWETTTATLGVFSLTGDPRWTYTLPERPLFDPITALFFYAGLLLALLRLRQPRYAFILIWLGVTLLPSAVTPQSPSTVRLIGAIPVVYLLPGLALAWVWQSGVKGQGRWRLAGYSALLALLLGITLFGTISQGFITWSLAEPTRFEHYQTVWRDIAWHWRQEAAAPRPLVVADSFFEPIDADSLRRNLGYDPQARWVQTGAQVAGAIIFPVNASQVEGRFYVPEFAAPAVSLLQAAGISQRPLYRSQDVPSFAVYALPPTFTLPDAPEPIDLEGKLTFWGYELLPLRAGRPLQVMTYWQVTSPLPWDLTAFMHVMADETTIVTQYDGLDVAPATLQPGDAFIQRHVLPWPDTPPTAPSWLQVGLYIPSENGRRLWRSQPPSGVPPDRIILTDTLVFDER